MTDDECDCSEFAPPDEYWVCPKCDMEWFPDNDEEMKEMDSLHSEMEASQYLEQSNG